MRLKAAIKGDLDKYLKAELKQAERAVTKGIGDATTGLKTAMRHQVTSAGLGSKLAKSWRGDIYPKRDISLNAAGHVYTKAGKILENFNKGTVIKSKDGFWLAIPTPNAPKKILGKRITPALYEKTKGVRLQFIYRANGPSLLVATHLRASYSRKNGGFKGFRKVGKNSPNKASVVMFWLVPQVKIPKLLSFEPEAYKWHNRISEFILKHWKD